MTMTALCPTLKNLPWAIGVAFISSALLAQSADAGQQLDGIEVRLAELEQRIEELAQAQRRADNDVRPDDAGSAAWTSWTPAEWRERYWRRRMMETRR